MQVLVKPLQNRATKRYRKTVGIGKGEKSKGTKNNIEI